MKSFEIKALGLEEMKSEEIIRTDGGIAAWVVLATVMTAVSLIDGVCEFARGYKEEAERLTK